MAFATMTPQFYQRPSLLIVGCGDIGMRLARLLKNKWRLVALTSTPARTAQLRGAGIRPLLGNLDMPDTLRHLKNLRVDALLHLAPPEREGMGDTRTRHLLAQLAGMAGLRQIVYGSTTGVYGDQHGAWCTENCRVNPGTARAHRRIDAENQLRNFGLRHGVPVTILRIPGIYACDRPGGHPRERLAKGTPVLQHEDDVYTNHIHADDLARAIAAALHRGKPQQVLNVCDDTVLKMGDYFDLAADLCGLPRPPRISRALAQLQLPAMQLSFMGESRRLGNAKLKRCLRFKLRYPTVVEGLSTPTKPAW
jgi:nucleoside-diphosphate-sugar epimerase